MSSPSSTQIAGRVSAEKSRARALERYYANPRRCQHCKNVIEVPPGKKVAEILKKKFCNQSCAASSNNRGVLRHGTDHYTCTSCGETLKKPRDKQQRARTRSVCDACLPGLHVRRARTPHRTKGDLYARTKNWQSANSTIRALARGVYFRSGRPRRCAVCGYQKHVHVCHVRDVSDFPPDTKISEINALTNLVALCPTHHWEEGHDELDLEAHTAVAREIAQLTLT